MKNSEGKPNIYNKKRAEEEAAQIKEISKKENVSYDEAHDLINKESKEKQNVESREPQERNKRNKEKLAQKTDELKREAAFIQEEFSFFMKSEEKISFEDQELFLKKIEDRIKEISEDYGEDFDDQRIHRDIVFYNHSKNVYFGIREEIERTRDLFQRKSKELLEKNRDQEMVDGKTGGLDKAIEEKKTKLDQKKNKLLQEAEKIINKNKGFDNFFQRIKSITSGDKVSLEDTKHEQEKARNIVDYFKGDEAEDHLKKMFYTQKKERILNDNDAIMKFNLEQRARIPVDEGKFEIEFLWTDYCNDARSSFFHFPQKQQELHKRKEDIEKQKQRIFLDIQGEIKELLEKTLLLEEAIEEEREWEDFCSEVMNEFMVSFEDEEDYKKKIEERGEKVSEIDEMSFRNIRESLECYFCYMHREKGIAKEETLEGLKKELENVEKTTKLFLGRGERGIRNILQEGMIKSIWDLSESERLERATELTGRGTGMDYLERRKASEENIGIHGENPISCYLESKNGRFEKGPPLQYGDYIIVLKNKLLERSVFSEADSMAPNVIPPLSDKRVLNIENRTLNFEHAMISKAMFNHYYWNPEERRHFYRGRPSSFNERDFSDTEYIEARILDGVYLNDIDCIVISNPEKIPEDIKNLLNENSIEIRTSVYE